MIKLEPFAEDKVNSLNQAWSLHELVTGEENWLEQVQADTVERYATKVAAARNVIRIAGHREKIAALIIRRNRAAIGIATIIPNQQIVHPEAGVFKGSDVDYWLRRDESGESHDEVVQRLLARSHAELSFATVLTEHPNPPRGFDSHMDTLGQPAGLSTGERDDPFDIARGGAPAQLYIHYEASPGLT